MFPDFSKIAEVGGQIQKFLDSAQAQLNRIEANQMAIMSAAGVTIPDETLKHFTMELKN